MPWDSQRQVAFLLSKGSPLSAGKKAKMKDELHQLGPDHYLKAKAGGLRGMALRAKKGK